MVGTKTAVDAARIYLATSVQMVSEYQQESKEAEQMRRELRQMGANANTDFDSFPALGGGGKGGRGGAGGRGDAGGRGGHGDHGDRNCDKPRGPLRGALPV